MASLKWDVLIFLVLATGISGNTEGELKSKAPCKTDYDCNGESKCNDDKFCVCEAGYEGDYCNVVTGCKHLEEYCREIGTKCVFDKNSARKATCECEYGYGYVPKFNICKGLYCYPTNPCKEGKCVYDKNIGAGYCKCSEEKYYNYKTQQCEDLPDKCVLRKYPCGENEVCVNGLCKCKYSKEPGEECKPTFCTPNPCFPSSNCSEHNGNCYCEEGTYYQNKTCKYTHCNLNDFKRTCTCPPGTKRIEGGACKPIEQEEVCFKDCGYGVCIAKRYKGTCRCFSEIAVPIGGKCILNQRLCPGEKLQYNLMKCKCEGQYVQADDGITCRLKTCDDIDAIKECASMGSECRMDWKGNGYYCKCPKGYEIGDKGICTDPCSIKKNIQACAVRGQICQNVFPSVNNNTFTCRCPPTIKLVNGKCNGEAIHVYMIEDIPVLKKKYVMKLGINKVLLNADLMISLEQTFSEDLFDYWYLYKFREEGDTIKCSVWINFKKSPSFWELRKIKVAPKPFSNHWYWAKSAIVWPPSLLLSEKGATEVKIKLLEFCSAEVKDLLCGKGSICQNNECACIEGFEIAEYSFRNVGDYKIQRCKDIDECATGIAKCPRNTTCVNTYGNYKCVCKNGFKKLYSKYDPETDKSDCYDMCTPSPCRNGTCSLKLNTFECYCSLGYAGTLCNRIDGNYLQSRSQTVFVGCILGVPLLILILFGFITCIIAMTNREVPGNVVPDPDVNHTEMTGMRPVEGEVNKAYQ